MDKQTKNLSKIKLDRSVQKCLTLASAFLFLMTAAISERAQAWGRRGHSITCDSAAYLIAAQDPKSTFLRKHSFDLAYYCNIPDFSWKKGELYKKEWFNHFMDMEIFDRAFKTLPKGAKPFALTRSEFGKEFPNIGDSAGRSFWRIRELMDGLHGVSVQLNQPGRSVEEQHLLQADWLLRAGAIGHYVGDLSQPFHVTENYDGQMSNQKGVHAWFEDELVDELYLGHNQSLERDVMTKAESRRKKLQARWSKMSVLDVIQDLADESNKALPLALKIDRAKGRKDIKVAAKAFRPMIVGQLALGSLAVAELLRREVGWPYDGKKFYDFIGSPEWIPTPGSDDGPPTSQTPKPVAPVTTDGPTPTPTP